MNAVAIDAAWRAAHPLPEIGSGLDKDARGRVLLIGGSITVPGALLLTGEAALRAGAGKMQIGTIAPAAMPLGLAFPEAAVFALPMSDDGEIALAAAPVLATPAERCDALVIGPAMAGGAPASSLVTALLDTISDQHALLLDAGAMTALRHAPHALHRLGGRVVLTPHHGELATMLGCDKDHVAAEPRKAAADAAERFDAVVVLKSAETFIASPDGTLLCYASEAPGLGTAGSGDVLAGVIGGLLARGAAAEVAAGWGVWLHGEAGKCASEAIGPLGFLARELLRHVPALMEAP